MPPFLRGTGRGWITAEYGMLPRSSPERIQREAARGKQTGRTVEIQRLIGRALRMAVDLEKLGECTITIDCDVLDADGGTRTASVTAGYVALHLAVANAMAKGTLTVNPLLDEVAAVSVGIVGGQPQLDLDYAWDSTADVDMNVIMTGSGKLIEIQGTAEHAPFSEGELAALLALAKKGCGELVAAQRACLAQALGEPGSPRGA